MKNIIVDLDGTIADDSVRAKEFLNKTCRECNGLGETLIDSDHNGEVRGKCYGCDGKGKYHLWSPYFEACHTDVPTKVVELLASIYSAVPIIIMSGRCESVRQKTEDWLAKHLVPYNKMFMRPIGCRIDDHIMKLQWGLMHSPPENTWCVIEDRNRVVEAWRGAGYLCLQPFVGNF